MDVAPKLSDDGGKTVDISMGYSKPRGDQQRQLVEECTQGLLKRLSLEEPASVVDIQL